MPDRLLVLNAGSSSLKFGLYTAELRPRMCLRGQFGGIGATPRFEARDAGGMAAPDLPSASKVDTHKEALAALLAWLDAQGVTGRLAGAGHRVVHGGASFSGPTLVDTETLRELEAIEPFAPLHQPHSLAAIRAMRALLPGLANVACFDTAFHRTQVPPAKRISLPRRYRARGLQRYGFHGLSYEYVAQALPAVTGALPARIVVAHLGNGSSLCAMREGRSVATTMGFSTLDGLVMSTRCGSLDPGVLLYLMREEGLDRAALEDLLYHGSGLLALSGDSGDMQALLAREDASAAEAVEQYCYQVTYHLGALAAVLGGLDALVFTAGIGENAAEVRARICRDAAWLGLEFDAAANAAGGPRISMATSAVGAWIVATDEEMVIARHTQAVLSPEAR